MKVVILAGGYGTRISEESAVRPKPMVEIGGMPILWHIMKIYGAHGHRDFVICAGYKSHMIKEYFAGYFLRSSDVTFDLAQNSFEAHGSEVEPWRVTVVDTGDATMTGGRLRRAREHLGDEAFCLTYGDCVADVDITALVDFHRDHDVLATVTAVQPPGRFGALSLGHDENKIEEFVEKPSGDGGWVNGGFFVCEPRVLDYVDSDATVWEREPLEGLARDDQLVAYRHHGYWQPMDTLRDKTVLEERWAADDAPWKTW
ncbi:MAG: glucose-phosphate cytidylyltransferase [Gaiellaceae bacterium]|nr:glucose-phosphate cytidylyltransferase [Gaiellaceae bacterium]MDX6489094.1 glucose-phosphate cytidylyltransferase [Gaiellaceae bacterium]